MDKLLQRVKNIIFLPRETWEVVKNEQTTSMEIVKNYLVYLIGMASIASFIGQSIIGYNTLFGHTRVAFFPGLFAAVLFIILSIIVIYISSIIINNLAENYGGVKDNSAAFKVVAYSSTAWYIARILTFIPRLQSLSLILGLYSLYLLYLGLPILMQSSKEKTMSYTLVSCLVVCVSFIVVLFIVNLLIGVSVPIF
jgi:hypothetical protein